MSDLESDHHIQTRTLPIPDISGAVPTSAEARAKRRIAALEEELQMMQQEKGTKQRLVLCHIAHSIPLAHWLPQKDNLLRFSRQGNSPYGCSLH